MKNYLINYVEKKYIKNDICLNIKIGYILRVQIWVIEFNKKRLQSFQGIVISIKNKGINSCFILRKISNGEGIERLFKFYSPIINKIIIVKKNTKKSKAKLYFLRDKNYKYF